jgi:hypothetical protein
VIKKERTRLRFDPYHAGIRAYQRGEPFDPDFGLRCKGWGTNSAQCLYERGRLKAAATSGACAASAKRAAQGYAEPLRLKYA